MNYKHITKPAFFLSVFGFLISIHGQNMVLKQKDTQAFDVREIHQDDRITLVISGLAFHSALAVKGIETKVSQNSLMIYVYLTRAQEGHSGSFNFVVPVPNHVNAVHFGNAETTVWKR